MISLKHFWACGYVSTSIFFSRKVKKGPILAIFLQFLPPNFCKLSPHKFSETLLLKKIYMICTIRDHSTFFIPVTIFEKSHFSEFSSQIYPLQIRHSKNLMPNLAFRIFPYISKICLFFPEHFWKVLKLFCNLLRRKLLNC